MPSGGTRGTVQYTEESYGIRPIPVFAHCLLLDIAKKKSAACRAEPHLVIYPYSSAQRTPKIVTIPACTVFTLAEEGGALANLAEKKRLQNLLASFPTTETEDEEILTGKLPVFLLVPGLYCFIDAVQVEFPQSFLLTSTKSCWLYQTTCLSASLGFVQQRLRGILCLCRGQKRYAPGITIYVPRCVPVLCRVRICQYSLV